MLFASLGLAQHGHASSIVYIGPDHNVHLVSPDGAVKHQVTSDGDETGAGRYRLPSQTDSGRIVALRGAPASAAFAHFLDRRTGAKTDSWKLPYNGSGSILPYSGAQVSPGGGMLVFDWWYYDCFPTCAGETRISFVAGPGQTNPCAINCHGGFARPRWIPGTSYAGFISSGFTHVYVQKASGPAPWIAVSDPDAAWFDSFDVSRQGRTLVSLSPPGSASEGQTKLADLLVLSNSGTPPDGDVSLRCTRANFAPSAANPRWSPDGKHISWTGSDGIYVSPAPTVSGGGVCDLSPKLVARGGKVADWGPAAVPAQAAPTTSSACRKAKKRLTRAKKALRKAKRSGRKAAIRKAKKEVRRAKKRKKRACSAASRVASRSADGAGELRLPPRPSEVRVTATGG